MRAVLRIALFVALLAPFAAQAFAAEPDQPDSLITQSDVIRIAVQNRLAEKFTATSERKKNEQGALVEFYSGPNQGPLWVDTKGLTERGKAVISEIKDADDYGLRSADYKLPNADGFNASDPNATGWLADAEIMVSYAVLDYALDARGGRIDPQRLSENLDPTLILPDPLEVIESIAIRSDPAAYLRSFQPDQPQFEALRQKLIELRGGKREAIAMAKPEIIIPDGPVLKMGIVNEQVALIRKRLDIPPGPGADENTYDMGLALAVQRFQQVHGAYGDGAVGPTTRRLLNDPGQRPAHQGASPATIKAILINMERWRWLPHDLGSFYVNVNIPEFLVRVIDDGKVVHTARVVVGKPEKQTPVLSNEIREIVFGPFWNVPTSIKTEEIRPYIRENASWFGGSGFDTTVFQRHDLHMKYLGQEVDPAAVDWNRVDIRKFEIYQPPGPDNVLGKVKFVFPNKHDVYMHDTPQKFYFAEAVRAESHGCMRVQNPDQLAAVLLNRDRGWSEARTESAMEDGYDTHVALQHKIPVYITYFTLKVNDDGSLTSYGDIYGHDTRMAAALGL
jgi:murein L,D-transpeptidase YcbB/YkuD